MIKSLYSKLAVALLGLFCLLGISFVVLTQFASDMYQQEVIQKLNRDLARQIVSQKTLLKNHQIDQKELEEIFDMMMVVNPGIEVYLLNPGGEILAYSAPPGKVKRDRVSVKPIKKWFETDPVFPLTGDDPRSLRGEKVFSVARIPEKGPIHGYLYIILGGELFDSIVQKLKDSYILRLSFWWIAASLVFVLVSGLMLFAYLTRRLRHLASVMNSLDMEQPAGQLQSISGKDRPQGDEIDRLSFTFKQLVKRIQTQMEKVKAADNLRRELVTNVSHDLRTPLATLQGYIETLLLKDKSLSAEDRDHHLEIAVRHCKRLSELVNELFELAKLDAREIQVRYEPFNIIELAHDVAQKFELSAGKRRVAIQVDPNPNLPLVNADIAMIERVIENLIQNALRYTPAGGTIRVTFILKNGDVSIGVSDTGSGIPKEDLPYIFDRYYQREKPRDKTGYSGLGLAIARRILELHNKPIHVESTLGSGTTFTFNLPVYLPF